MTPFQPYCSNRQRTQNKIVLPRSDPVVVADDAAGVLLGLHLLLLADLPLLHLVLVDPHDLHPGVAAPAPHAPVHDGREELDHLCGRVVDGHVGDHVCGWWASVTKVWPVNRSHWCSLSDNALSLVNVVSFEPGPHL